MRTVHQEVLTALAVLALLVPNAHAAETGNESGVAVIIGNKEYADDRFRDVSYAHNDAEAFKRFVTGRLGFDPRKVMDLRDATKTQMESAFGTRDVQGLLYRWAEPDSDIVVFYSGHGMEGTNSAGAYLLPVDANKDTAEANGYPIEQMYENLGKVPHKSVTVFLDACFSGVGGEPIDNASPVTRGADLSGAAGVVGMTVLTAASGSQWANWDAGSQHGLFTEHLLNGLYGAADADGDGQVTAREAKVHLDRTMTWAARSAYGREQDAGLLGNERAVLSFASPGGWGSRPRLGPPRFRDCPECPEMVVVPAGSFVMGSPSYEEGRDDDEGPLREVEFTVPFAIGVYEVTVGEFKRFVQASGSSAGETCHEGGKLVEGRSWRDPGFRQDDSHPVVCVSWDDAQAYVRWLSAKTGKRYRLPSESEWEYAARAGTQNSRPWGDDDSGQCRHANSVDGDFERSFADSSKEPCADSNVSCAFWQMLRRQAREAAQCDDGHAHTAPVGRYEANKWGLHDVLGNVFEWTEDCLNDSYAGAPRDGSAWRTGKCSKKALRGGGWAVASTHRGWPRAFGLRFAERSGGETDYSMNFGGFRVVRTLAP